MKYVMFLRGINVGGIKVPMADLRTCLEKLGLRKVRTWLATGNVAFESDEKLDTLKAKIEQALGQTFGYEAFVLIYPASILAKVITDYPFPDQDNVHRYAIFCADDNVITDLMSTRDSLDPSVEDIAAGMHVVYWRVPVGSTLGTPFSVILSKSKYKAVTTNRNLNTLEKMA